MILHPGDKVRIKKDIFPSPDFYKVGVVENMVLFAGETVTIDSVEDWGGVSIYGIVEDDDNFHWSEDLLDEDYDTTSESLTAMLKSLEKMLTELE